MLTALRGSTGGIVAKTFLVLLAGSFAVWGVADVFRGNSDVTLAKVGKTEISANEFRQFFNDRLQTLGQRTGQVLTVDQARSAGLDRQILGDLLRSTALDEQARKLKMSLAPAFVVKQVEKNPAYRDSSGKFNIQALRNRLQSANLSEQQFIINERKNLIRQTITSAMSDGIAIPQTLLELVVRQAREKRDASYFVVTGDGIEIKDPDEKQIEEFFNKNKSRFAIPEKRIFEIISVSAEELGKGVDVSEEKLKATYENQKARFSTPEKRTIEQIPFANIKDATATLKRIREGASFESIAKEMKLSENDRKFGEFTKAEVPDKAIADAAFGLKEGDVSDVVEGKLSIFLIKVTKVTPESVKTFAEVRDELVKKLKRSAGRDLILDLRDKVEDERGAGTAFKEIAKSLSLTYLKTPALNRVGLDDNGKEVTGVPDWSKVLKAGNSSDAGLEIDPIATSNDGFVWINVAEVIPTHIQPLKDAKEKAIKLWKAAELRKAVENKAKNLFEEAKKSGSLEEAAKTADAEIKKELGITRRTSSANFDAAAVSALFKVAPNGFAFAVNPDGKSAKVMRSSPVLAPPFDPKATESKKVAGQLKRLVSNDLFASYMSELQKAVGTEIAPEGWARVFQSSTR
jgi:peptidyl-prolyl cis-trans isomerase D